MAYDERLAERVRDALADQPGVTERKMFGGLGFMVDGAMAVAAASAGSLMVRVDPAGSAALVAEDGVAPMVMRGRELAGWLLVEPDAIEGDAQLRRWVDLGVAYVRTLPPKKGE